MTPSQRGRQGCGEGRKWRAAAPLVPLLKQLKHPGGASQAWPLHLYPKGQVIRSHPLPPPHIPRFHTRHAEESAERPHLVTIVRPCGQSAPRKVTVLLNRRGVVSFEQLLLDVSEALGFPRWHKARVTRLYTTHAREVKGVCDFFQSDVAFLALGKARPDLSSVQEALQELFPEHCHYQAEALKAWEKRLHPAPDKAAKADSGYSEGTDSSETHVDQKIHQDRKSHNKNHIDTHTIRQQPHHVNTQWPENDNSEAQKKNPWRKPAHLPNHLQRLRVSEVRERQPSVIGPFKYDERLREENVPSPTLCRNCLVRRAKHQLPERIDWLSGRVPLPPVSRKNGSSNTQQEVRKLPVQISPLLPQPVNGEELKCAAQLPLTDPLPEAGHPHIGSGLQKKTTLDLPSDSSDVTLEDIERCYDIGRVVGDGNFAVVRECRPRDNMQTLAVKIVDRSKLVGREHMMQNELSLLSSLCHPRIVRLFAHHHTHTHSYLVMELVGGGDLFDAINEKGRFSESEAALMVSDVSEALNYIHCKSIVHRDVKPENLLMECTAPGICRLKLGDFGLAMVVTEAVFTICGTPTYVAPEILCETGYGVAVDVWALGVILYILLCGFPPFRSKERDQDELFQLIKQGHFHFLSPYWDPISEEARGLVTALLQPDPMMRLTAEQTWLHPWVMAMASICRQRALTDRAEKSIADDAAEPDRIHKIASSKVPEKMADKTLRHTSRPTKSIQKELSTSSEGTAGAQRPEFTPTGSPCSGSTHDPDYNLGCQLGDPSTQSDPPGQMKRQSQESQEQSLPYSPTSTNEAQQTTGSH